MEVSSANAGFTIGGDVGLPVQVVRSPVVSTLKNSDVHKTVDTSKDKYYEVPVQSETVSMFSFYQILIGHIPRPIRN